jgi:AraC-like DNA-binding protein
VKAARLNAALSSISARFQEPGLRIATVAETQGISTRYLQQLLESSGTSFTAYINDLRLQRAFKLLTEHPERRIVEIALEVGFSDISHFNRLFRARFGDTPSGVRDRAKWGKWRTVSRHHLRREGRIASYGPFTTSVPARPRAPVFPTTRQVGQQRL